MFFAKKAQTKWDNPAWERCSGTLPYIVEKEYWQEPVLREGDLFPRESVQVVKKSKVMSIVTPLSSYHESGKFIGE